MRRVLFAHRSIPAHAIAASRALKAQPVGYGRRKRGPESRPNTTFAGPLFEPRVGIVTLGSPAVINFVPTAEGEHAAASGLPLERASVLLQPRSLLLFDSLAYTAMARPAPRTPFLSRVALCSAHSLKRYRWIVGHSIAATRALTEQPIEPRQEERGLKFVQNDSRRPTESTVSPRSASGRTCATLARAPTRASDQTT